MGLEEENRLNKLRARITPRHVPAPIYLPPVPMGHGRALLHNLRHLSPPPPPPTLIPPPVWIQNNRPPVLTPPFIPIRARLSPCKACILDRTTEHSTPCWHMQACPRCARTVHPCRCTNCIGEEIPPRPPRYCPVCPRVTYVKVYIHADRSVPTLN